MKLELADLGNKRDVFVRQYTRGANLVPSYRRRRPLHDSSLFSFKLADGCACVYLAVPDPNNRQAPRLVREDVFASLPDSEYFKLINYCRAFNSTEAIDTIVQNRSAMGDGELVLPADATAADVVDQVHSIDPDGELVKTDSFWDEKTLGIENKYFVPGAALAAYFLFRS